MGHCWSGSKLGERVTHQPKQSSTNDSPVLADGDDETLPASASAGSYVPRRVLDEPLLAYMCPDMWPARFNDGDDRPALTNSNDEADFKQLTPLPSVKYSPGLEYDMPFSRFVKNLGLTPLIDDLIGMYNILMVRENGGRFVTTSSDDEMSLFVTSVDDGRIKFEIAGRSFFGDYSGNPSVLIKAKCIRMYSQDIRLGELRRLCATVYFVGQRGAFFYAGKEHNRGKTRCPLVSMVHAEKKLADFANARYTDNHWIHQKLGLPVEVAAEVYQFLMAPMPPPVFFLEKGDLLLAANCGAGSHTYVARKKKRSR